MIRRNSRGRYYYLRAEPHLWLQIIQELVDNPEAKQTEIAEKVGVSDATVSRVINHKSLGKRERSYKTARKTSTGMQLVVGDILDKYPNLTLQELRGVLSEVGFTLTLTSIWRITKKLNKKRIIPIREDPRKWKPANAVYYEEYRLWMQSLSSGDRSSIAYFDEVRVDRTGKVLYKL
jgi:transposase